jgi:hypothetical protein
MILINLLIYFFIILIGYQLFLAWTGGDTSLIEGLENNTNTTETKEYQPYNMNDPNNALILAQQNAGNIEVLKGRIDGLDGIKARVDTIQQNIDSMQVQIDALVQQQADYANDLAGDQPVEVTGTGEEDEDEEETEM